MKMQWHSVIVAVIVGPLAEEVMFRGKLYETIDRAYGYVAAIIVTSLLFGIFHGNITQFIYAIIFFAFVLSSLLMFGIADLFFILFQLSNWSDSLTVFSYYINQRKVLNRKFKNIYIIICLICLWFPVLDIISLIILNRFNKNNLIFSDIPIIDIK